MHLGAWASSNHHEAVYDRQSWLKKKGKQQQKEHKTKALKKWFQEVQADRRLSIYGRYSRGLLHYSGHGIWVADLADFRHWPLDAANEGSSTRGLRYDKV